MHGPRQNIHSLDSISHDMDGAINSQSLQDDGRTRLHSFRLGELNLLINTNHIIAEIMDVLSFCQLPNTAPWLYGIANNRSKIVPIFDLALASGLADYLLPSTRFFLILHLKKGPAGILVSRLPERVILEDDSQCTVDWEINQFLQPYINNVYKQNNKLLYECDWDELFQHLSETVTL